MLSMDNTYLYVKLDWDANRFLPAEGKVECMNDASREFRNMSARRVKCANVNADYLLENLSCEDHENVVN